MSKKTNPNKKYIIYGSVIAVLLVAVIYVNFVMGGSDTPSGEPNAELVQNENNPAPEENTPAEPSTPDPASPSPEETPSSTEPNPGANEKIANRFPGAGKISKLGRNPFQDPPQKETPDPNAPA